MRKIAITGAGGFLGTEILRQLASNKEVKIFAFTSDPEKIENTFAGVKNIVPIKNTEAFQFDYSNIDILLNCAFPRNADGADFSGGLDYIAQVMIKAAADHVKGVINISSQSVYSQKREKAADETAPIILESKYAVGKYAIEMLTEALFKDIPHTNLRMASLIGAGFNQRITNKFTQAVIAGEKIHIKGGNQLFGFMDVRDAAGGIIALIVKENVFWKKIYNFGSNQAYTLKEIAQTVCDVGVQHGYTNSEICMLEEGVWSNSSLISENFCKDMKWKPRYDLVESVNDIFESYLKA